MSSVAVHCSSALVTRAAAHPAQLSSASWQMLVAKHLPLLLLCETFDLQVRFVRLYFLYLNALYPMVCKTSFYHCGLRLGEHALGRGLELPLVLFCEMPPTWLSYTPPRAGVLDVVTAVCEDTVPHCDHANGDCSAMTFAPFDVAAAARSVGYYGPSSSAGGFAGGGGGVYGSTITTRTGATWDFMHLALAHMAQLPSYFLTPQANTPAQLAAARACYYGLLAVGARMDGQTDRADTYLAR